MTAPPLSRDDEPVSGTRGRASAAWVAVVVAVVNTLGLAVAYVVSRAHHLSWDLEASGAWINVVAGPTFPLLTALVLRTLGADTTRPRREARLALLLLVWGTICAGTIVLHVAAEIALERHSPVAVSLAWVSSWLWIGVPNGAVLVLLLFPTGEPPRRGWRVVEGLVGLAALGMWLSIAFAPGPLTDFPARPTNSLGWRAAAPVLQVAGGIGFALLAVAFFASSASVVDRFRLGSPGERRQLRWFLLMVALVVAMIAAPTPPGFHGAAVAMHVAVTCLVPVTLAFTLVRRGGLPVPAVLVGAVMTAVLLLGYSAALAAADGLGLATTTAAPIVGACLALLGVPLYRVIDRAADRLVYGDRGEPGRAVAEIGRRAASTPGALLDEILDAVRDGLRTPGAAVRLVDEEEDIARVGVVDQDAERVTLTVSGRPVGVLLLASRGSDDVLGERDRRMIAQFVPHVAIAAHAAGLARDLERSRRELVVTREEERRRIRRNLHDGLGPALAGVAFGIEAARNGLPVTANGVGPALADLKQDVLTALADVRRLVYDLRPPVLDEYGLVTALEQYAARTDETAGLRVRVEAGPLPVLSAAVEAAAYRIATEAITNAVRHSRGTTVQVGLEVADGALLVRVADDGVGAAGQPGVGLQSMRERAAELGGSCVVRLVEPHGTEVTAALPLEASS